MCAVGYIPSVRWLVVMLLVGCGRGGVGDWTKATPSTMSGVVDGVPFTIELPSVMKAQAPDQYGTLFELRDGDRNLELYRGEQRAPALPAMGRKIGTPKPHCDRRGGVDRMGQFGISRARVRKSPASRAAR